MKPSASQDLCDQLKFDRLPATLEQVGLRKSQWYELVSLKEAPQPVRLGGRTVAWERSEVQAWMRARLQARK